MIKIIVLVGLIVSITFLVIAHTAGDMESIVYFGLMSILLKMEMDNG